MKFIQALLMTICLLTTSCFSMKENEIISNNNERDQEKEIIHKPGFKKIGDHEITEKNNDDESSEDTNDEAYEKRHQKHELEEKKRNKKHRIAEKQKKDRWTKKFEKNKKSHLCICYVKNKSSIQCGSCQEWHMIPKELIQKFGKDQIFECIDITWDPHMSEQCLEKKFSVENKEIEKK